MFRSLGLLVAALLGVRLVSLAFTAVSPSSHAGAAQSTGSAQRFLAPAATDEFVGSSTPACLALGGALVAVALIAGSTRRGAASMRSQVVACRAQEDAFESAQKAAASAAAAALMAGAVAAPADAYPIFAQQNYKDPVAPTGRIVCANCHLQMKPLVVANPHTVYPDTIFKIKIDIPAKYDKRMQPLPDGSKGPMNVGAIAVLPEGWKIAPRDRLPKVIKKEMKGLSWAPYSKEAQNIAVVGPVPGAKYEHMVLPVLAPIPDGKNIFFDTYEFNFAGNRGRGQVYPEGNLSNNNMFTAKESGTIKSIEGDKSASKITVTKTDGTDYTVDILAGADIVVKEGDKVEKDQQLTTNPNVGGFGQELKDIVLQDINRVYAVQALMASIFIAQLTFVLKKKQFEKVQLAEGF
jgi:apocytochrome f